MSTRAKRPCQVCQHPDRAAIEQAILNGRAVREVARTFQIGSNPGTPQFRDNHHKVERHRDECMGEAYRATLDESTQEVGNALHARMAVLDEAVDEALSRAREGDPVVDENGQVLDPETGNPVRRYNDRLLLAAVREARRNVDMHARLLGILPEGDGKAAEASRKGLEDPKVRRLIAEAEAALAAASEG